MDTDASSANLPKAPKYRLINYRVNNKQLAEHIRQALGDAGNPSARVFVGESPEREGWAIRCLVVEGGPESDVKLLMTPTDETATCLVTQRGRTMTWVRLEVLLEQVQKWLGGDARVALMFNWMRITAIDGKPEHVESGNLSRRPLSKAMEWESEATDE